MNDSPNGNEAGPKKQFGAFGGVFTPSILTILGVVMYMRLGWVTGQVGLGGALLIVVIAHLISLATGLSVSSIATNRTVGAGGAYFMISRALGAPAGAAIGIPLFFAQALSVTFYLVGFTESLAQLVPGLPRVVVSTVVNVALTALSLKGADLVIRAQYFVMGAIALSLVAVFTGRTESFPANIEWFHQGTQSLPAVFAVFFPAVTGIMAGVSMSGDLKDPRKAIPRGTILAILAGFIVYALFPVWLSLNASNDELIKNLDTVFQMSSVPALIYVGVWGATLSSALGSILTAPRTLQALAFDGLVPRLFGKGFGGSSEPRIGTLFTFALAQAGIFLGSLDAIAPVLTMFFLATYGVTNLACGLQKWAASPSFRPSFRVPAAISLLGSLACFYVMSIIDMLAMFLALAVCLVVFALAQRRALGTTYGDARHGIWAALVRAALFRLRRAEFHPENWRPNLLILGGDPKERPHLLELGSAIVQDRGVVTLFHFITGSVEDNAQKRKELFQKNEHQIAQEFPHVYYRVDIVDDIHQSTVAVAQAYGVGHFSANSVLLGWPKRAERSPRYIPMLRDLITLDCSLLLLRYDAERGWGKKRHIHIWWGGLEGNGALMLLLAFLLTAQGRWRKAKVTLLTAVGTQEEERTAEEKLQTLLKSARIPAQTRVIARNGQRTADIMQAESQNADLALVGFRLPDADEDPETFYEGIQAITEPLPTTILVRSAKDFQGAPILFDDP